MLQLQRSRTYIERLSKEEEKKVFGGKELHTYIRGMIKEMTEEEKEKFYAEAEDSGL